MGGTGAGRDTGPPRPYVAELRQYTLRPGRRDDLVGLFDTHLVEPQEEAGMRIVGQFRDLDDPQRFVWIRTFPGMAARTEALSAFYLRHPAWREHRDTANDTMADSDNVLLLRPSGPDDDLPAAEAPRPGVAAAGVPDSLVTVEIHHLVDEASLREFADFFAERIRPALADCGAPPVASFVTEPAENGFPALPVRTGEHVFVHLQRFAGPGAHRAHLERLAARPGWREDTAPELTKRLARPAERLRLTPTARSQLR